MAVPSSPTATDIGLEAEHREVFLHTEPLVFAKRPLQRLAIALGLGESAFAKSPGESVTNEIHTSKYTPLTFIPINLFEQFSRFANLYFLLVAGLQLIPGLSPTSWFTSVFPLVCVLAINAVKEGISDYHRHKSDAEINSRTVLVLQRGGVEKPTAWRDVIVGDVVKVLQDQEVPADLLFLSSSDATHVGHVETANLDGETNLKLKMALKQTSGVQTADELDNFERRLTVHCEMPTARLYVFDGALVDRIDPDSPHVPLGADNLLLRGCTLRKTSWVVGLVVSTGAHTKIQMNRLPSPRKITQLERHMNVLVLIIFCILVTIAFLLSAGYVAMQKQQSGAWYLQFQNQWPDFNPGFASWVVQVIRYIILMCGMIPISLYVSLEMVKVLQCLIIFNTDRQMYHADTDTPFSCRTTTLNEDLGQVAYVLSDKTGTLTQNVMGFVWASIGGRLYGPPMADKQEGDPPAPPPKVSHIPAKTPHTLALDPELHSKLGSHFTNLSAYGHTPAGATAMPHAPQQTSERGAMESAPDPEVARYFTHLAVCNTVIPQVLENGRYVYQASSPDEEALVEGAAYAGYRLESRSAERAEVWYHGQRHIYQVLCVLEFNSDRKRMSIICRCPDGKIRLFCKGADTMVMARLKPGQQNVSIVRRHLEEMAQAGYRTLCVAEREIDGATWDHWFKEFHAASVALEGRDAKLDAAAEKIEVELELIGASAVEDKLQDGVPEAIASLVAAGIKVWVLTGDKMETAISIALSCRLFTEDMALVEMRERDFESNLVGAPSAATLASGGTVAAASVQSTASAGNLDLEHQVLQQKLDEVDAENLRLEYEAGARGPRSGAQAAGGVKNVGLVVEGGALAVCLKKEHQDDFIKLCTTCKSVVCCRVSPMQKGAVTRLVQTKCGAITLGIGDGANDVGMIQAAHIGCGISGREGRAAVLASDFSFAQFRFVARLVLLHGRAMYKRNAEVVLFSFYKNWMYNWLYAFLGFVSAFSTQPIFTTGLISTLNLAWASLPIIVYALFEQDASQETIMKHPELYAETMRASRRSFLFSQLQWIGLGSWHALAVYFPAMYTMTTPDQNGRMNDLETVGCGVYMALVIVLNLKMAMRSRFFTWVNHLMLWASILLFFPFLWLYGLVWPVAKIDGTADMSDIVNALYASPTFWLAGVVLSPALALLLDITIMLFRRHLRPTNVEILQEVEYQESVRQEALRKLGIGKGLQGPAPGRNGAVELRASPVTHVVSV